uniref:Uncharacterized protein n=1 Tax=Ditylenchus dipsaci TaxID=166011 RepID=A0A915DBF0_9BILA
MTSDQAHESHCRREYAGAKISKVKFLLDEYDNAEYFVTGSWAKPNMQRLTLLLFGALKMSQQKSHQESKSFLAKRSNRMSTIYQWSLSLDLWLDSAMVTSKFSDVAVKHWKAKQPTPLFTPRLRQQLYVWSLIQFFSGSDTGSIVRIPMDSSYSSQTSIVTTDLMEVTSLVSYGTSQLVSAHTTGQFPKLFAALNDSVTAIASHPSEPNVIAFGTNSGHISFFDIRAPSQDFRIY